MTEDNTFEDVADWLLEYRSATDLKIKKKLKELIVLTCMSIVKKIAHSLARRSTDPVEDIIQVGSLGLIKAVDLYNPEISKNFKSYATYLLTGEIRHYLRDKASMIKAPREIQELACRRKHQQPISVIQLPTSFLAPELAEGWTAGASQPTVA